MMDNFQLSSTANAMADVPYKMNSVESNTNIQLRALCRSSLSEIRDSSPPSQGTFPNTYIANTTNRSDDYANIENRTNKAQTTTINIGGAYYIDEIPPKHIKLVINRNSEIEDSVTHEQSEQDLNLYNLMNEYQSYLGKKDCENKSCHRFKFLSQKISQTLIDEISALKSDPKLVNNNTNNSRISNLLCTLHTSNISTNPDANSSMDRDSLIGLVVEKDRRIQDLEKLVEDQKRLRLQDADQVEEKAARIKEWVANKLKELENQNKQLRDQNKKQKETMDSLSNKLASLSHKPDPSSNFNCSSIDVDKSLRMRRPLLKKTIASKSVVSSQEFQSPKMEPNTNQKPGIIIRNMIRDTSSDYNIYNPKDNSHTRALQSSPVYDSVTIEINRRACKRREDVGDVLKTSCSDVSMPPPPPLHRSDAWEQQLYNLAEENFSTVSKQSPVDRCNESIGQSDSIDSWSNSDKDLSTSRKSSSSYRNDLISLVRPSYTTIDGDHVIDNLTFESSFEDNNSRLRSLSDESSSIKSNLDRNRLKQINRAQVDVIEITSKTDQSLTPNLFDSPLRSKSCKGNILRTQSVRKYPEPEKLYEFITSDLVKRGYLIKPGALKNYNRWFVLKNFHVYSYKNELDEASKATPSMALKLNSCCRVTTVNQSGDSNYPFKITFVDKTLQLVADSTQSRDEWIRILTVAINLSDIQANTLTRQNSVYDGLLSFTRHGVTKKCYATIISRVIFFLRSISDPIPIGYLSIKGAKIREITDSLDHDFEEQLKQYTHFQDCSLAIYPRYAMTLDPVYITLGCQEETDKWFHYLSLESGVDQSYGTCFEMTMANIMMSNSLKDQNWASSNCLPICPWQDKSIMLYSSQPITQPLTSLPNETLQKDAIELFKSILLFTQAPLEPIAIDYHVSLIQNCLSRFLKCPELRNEFYAQLIKQITFIIHRCDEKKMSVNDHSNSNSRTNSCYEHWNFSECELMTDIELLDSLANDKTTKVNSSSLVTCPTSTIGLRDKNGNEANHFSVPSKTEMIQVMQMLAIAVSLNLPRGRLRWWLTDYLRKFANPVTTIGKYALFTLRAIDRAILKGPRENVPSRTEIMSILLRNPYDHSSPHSLPVSFCDGSYLVVECDGSTTVDEFLSTMSKDTNIRHFSLSDFYLFADDPSGSKELHILEPQRKILDIVGWWEQTFRRHNSGRYQNTKTIRMTCKKRLVLRSEEDETQQERLLIVHQLNQEIITQRLPLSDALALELCVLMAQLNFGDIDRFNDPNLIKCKLEKVLSSYLPNRSSHQGNHRSSNESNDSHSDVANRWQHLSGKSAQDCIRIYLNCIRRLKYQNEG